MELWRNAIGIWWKWQQTPGLGYSLRFAYLKTHGPFCSRESNCLVSPSSIFDEEDVYSFNFSMVYWLLVEELQTELFVSGTRLQGNLSMSLTQGVKFAIWHGQRIRMNLLVLMDTLKTKSWSGSIPISNKWPTWLATRFVYYTWPCLLMDKTL